jgi:hypothetical protein
VAAEQQPVAAAERQHKRATLPRVLVVVHDPPATASSKGPAAPAAAAPVVAPAPAAPAPAVSTPAAPAAPAVTSSGSD